MDALATDREPLPALPSFVLPALAVTAAMLMVLLLIGGIQGSIAGIGGAEGSAGEPGVSSFARADIPPRFLSLYLAAARRYGLDWSILAGIGKVECDNGEDPAPSCGTPGAVNSAGAGGPMQFLASTWAIYGVDGDGDGEIDRWDPADAIFSAANYLRASGAPGDYERAIFAYNHADWYVREVEEWASRYRGGEAENAANGGGPPGPGEETLLAGLQAASPTEVRPIAGTRARLDPLDGHLALIPTEVPAAVQAMLVAGNELQDLPYGPDGHPDPLGALDQDCSSTINYVLYRAGIRPLSEIVKENPLAQSYTRWGDQGPGRWVTIYATETPTPHVFATIAGLRLDTSYAGTDIGPNRDQSGPRWRIFPTIPTWAHWSIRHPPGL